MHAAPETTTAVTDVGEFITDLDAGQFDRMLSAALSQVAAGVVDNNKVGEVNVKLTFERIPGTHQVSVKHALKFSKPTADGKAGEEATRKTVMHVGKFGKLTLTPPNQMSMFNKQGQPSATA